MPPDKPPVAEPPGKEGGELGEAPDWQDCPGGWRGQYSNLPADHPWVTPRPRDGEVPTTPEGLALWDAPSFEQFDPSLDFGSGFWPVDEGLEEDPRYFAVYWHAWIRAWSDTTLSFLLGASDDAFVAIGGELVAERPGIHPLVRDRFDVPLEGGQYPIEVWYAHRGSDVAGMSLRVIGGDVTLCYPDLAADDEAP